MRRVLAVLVLSVCGLPRDAAACDCPAFDERAAIANHDLVFDGWVLGVADPWRCPVPAAPKPRAGCVRIAVVARENCVASGALLSLVDDAADHTYSFVTLEGGAATFCNIKAGRYTVAGTRWLGHHDDGTLTFGRAIDVVPGGSYVVFEGASVSEPVDVGVLRVLKGQVPRQVKVRSEPWCAQKYLSTGLALRFFGSRADDGSVVLRGCSTVRELDDRERFEVVEAAKPAPPPAPPPTTPTTTPPESTPTGSCAAGGSSSLALCLLVALLAARSARVVSSSSRS